VGVRRETVVLSLEDHFSTGMAKAAANVALADRSLDHLSTQAVNSSKATRSLDRDVDKLGSTTSKTNKEIDKLSGRLNLLRDSAILLGPAVVSAGALGAAGIAGLTAVLGTAVLGAGTAILAFQGVGDALKAVNKAALEPTEANLAAAHQAMGQLSGSSREFVRELQHLMPTLLDLRDAAADGFLPGLTDGIESLETALPKIEKIISSVSGELGDIAADAGASLASDRWEPFLDFLADEAPFALGSMAKAIGSISHALATLWMATTPINNGFLDWLVKATDDLDKWAEGLDQTQGFQDFVAYVDETGPQVLATIGAIANMFLQVAEAAAPLGGPVLKGLELIAKAVSAIADSDLGAPIFAGLAALTLYNRALATTVKLQGTAFGKALLTSGGAFGGVGPGGVKGLTSDISLLRRESAGLKIPTKGFVGPLTEAQSAAERTRTAIGGIARGGLQIGLVGVAASGLADKFGLANTASLALAGSMTPIGLFGAVIGAAAGGVLDLAKALDNSDERAAKYARTLDLLATKAGPNLKDQLAAVNDEIDKIQGGGENPYAGEGAGLASARRALNPDSTVDKDKLKLAKAAHDQLTDAIKKQGYAEDAATSSTARMTAAQQRQATALQAARTEAEKSGTQFLAYGKDLDDSKVSLDKWIKNQQDQVDALRNATRNALTASDKGVAGGLIQKLMTEGPAGALRLKELASGTRAQVEAANRAFRQGLSALNGWEDAGARIQNRLNAIAAHKYLAKIDADTDPAMAALLRLQYDIARMHFSVKVTASTNATVAEAGTSAGGGSVPDDGGPYTDRFLYKLAPGEEIISNRNGEADQFRADRAAGLIPGYAAGGTVSLPWGVSRPPSGMPTLPWGATSGTGPGGLKGFIADQLDMKFPATLKQWNAALKASTSLLQKEKDKRQALLDQADQVRSSITSNYRTDLFGQPDTSSVWMSNADRAKAGKGDVFSTLTGDIGNLGALTAAEKKLKATGLDSTAYAELVSNASLDEVEAFANGSKADVMKYERLFNQREQALATAGNVGANAAFGPALAASKAQVAATAANTRAIERIEKKLDTAMQKAAPKRRP
jgi:hypothetical protein